MDANLAIQHLKETDLLAGRVSQLTSGELNSTSFNWCRVETEVTSQKKWSRGE